jgi:hypothetical protein
MIVTAKEDHVCSCCGRTIKKGEKCYVYFLNYPKDPNREYEVLYECEECVERALKRLWSLRK